MRKCATHPAPRRPPALTSAVIFLAPQAGGKHYHPTCARCVRCHQMFTEGEEMYLTGKQAWPRAGKEARSPATAASALLARPQDGTSSPSPGGLGRLPLWLVGRDL